VYGTMLSKPSVARNARICSATDSPTATPSVSDWPSGIAASEVTNEPLVCDERFLLAGRDLRTSVAQQTTLASVEVPP
jgi:hypothetical protein